MPTIWCVKCGGEREAERRTGPLPGARRPLRTVGVWNVCRACGAHHWTIGASAVPARRLRRAAARAGQLNLFPEAA